MFTPTRGSSSQIRIQHLLNVGEASDGRRAATEAKVLLVEAGGEIAGHCIVRVEEEHDREIGLFSTTYVDPAHRRAGLASLLPAAGEHWMRHVGMTEAASYTDADNLKLIELYRRHGYSVATIDPEWVRVHRHLD